MKRKVTIVIVFVIILAGLLILWHRKSRFQMNQPFPVAIADGGNNFATLTSAKTVADLLAEKKILVSDKDYIFPAPDAKIFPGTQIFVRRALPVSIEADGQTVKIDTLGTNVRDAILEAGVALSPVDRIAPDATSLLSPDLDIKIIRINFQDITVSEEIPFQTVQQNDSTVLWKHTAVKQEGGKGTREKYYKITYTDGKETSRTLTGSKVVQAPTPEIDVVGTKIVVGKTQQGGATWYANGSDLTCASLDFSHGKYLRVTNRANGKSVIVQVNDSGPYGKGRVIDLNKIAFQKIADLGAGVINVKVEEILN